MTTPSTQTRSQTSSPEALAGSPWHLALLSAGSEAELAHGIELIRARLAEQAQPDQPRIHVHTVDTASSQHRGALLFSGAREVAEARGAPSAIDGAAPPIALMFSGLGDHYIDMGLALYRHEPIFRQQVDLCAELLAPELGADIRDIMYPDRNDPGREARKAEEAPAKGLDLRRMLGRDGRAPSAHEARLNQTRFAQPALFVIEYALAALWRSFGVRAEIMIGYSLGEYVAACLAGVLSLEDSLTLVARRAQLIETLPPGAMLAISLPEHEVTPFLGAHLSLSAINGPELCVVAGPPEEVDALARQLAQRGVTARRVQSSHAFHSKMMEPITDTLIRLTRSYTLAPPQIDYVSNVTGAPITVSQATDPSYWATHLCRPVRFADGLGAVFQRRARVLLETGPGRTLSSLATVHPLRESVKDVVSSMRHAYEPQPDTEILLRAVSRLWLAGAALDWDHFPCESLALDGDARAAHGSSPSAPRHAGPEASATERQLADVWKKVLGSEAVSRDDNFFEIGGNSLLAMRLGLRITRTFEVELSLRQLYELQPLWAMAAAIDSRQGTAATSQPAPVAQAVAPGESATATSARMRLPNGLEIAHQYEAETDHFYQDIFVQRSYAKNGITIPQGCIFDVGANIGMFTLFAHTETSTAQIYSFEPAPPLFRILQQNVKDHRVRAKVFNFGISDVEREATFTFYPRSSGMSTFHADAAEERHILKSIMDNHRKHDMPELNEFASSQDELFDLRLQAETFTAKLRRLSDVIREQGVERIDLLKVDVQKCELEVINGIDDEDWPKIQQIVLEVHDTDDRVNTLTSIFERRGFSVTAKQDELYVGTNIYNLYAIRSQSAQ
jgi:phthiocerol/phenolphthiocerol synthesis type-I polyketide synthase E